MLRRVFALGIACTALASARARAAAGDLAGRVEADAIARARHDFARLADESAALPTPQRFHSANTAINQRVEFADDAEFGAADVWQTPYETLARGRGDCEDIAIAKYFLLLAADIDSAQLRLLFAWHRDPAVPGIATAHVVALALEPVSDPLVLDNINLLALPLSLRVDLEPLFSFDRTRLWRGTDGPSRAVATQRLPAWRQLLARFADQQAD